MGQVNATDFSKYFIPSFKKGVDFESVGTDMNCSGAVNATDFSAQFAPQFKAGKAGPSGLYCAGTVPCDL